MTTRSLKQLVYGILGVLDLSQEVTAVQHDRSTAPANKLFVTLQPSERLCRILSAIAAGDVNCLVIEHKELLKQKNTPTPAGRKKPAAGDVVGASNPSRSSG